MLMDGVIVDPQDQAICELVGNALSKFYPGHEWLVEADRRKGMIDIRNLDLHGGKGFRLKMSGAASVSELEHLAMQAGGELLERANVARGAMTENTLHEINYNRQHDARGNVIMQED
jgi:hypothetical protein